MISVHILPRAIIFLIDFCSISVFFVIFIYWNLFRSQREICRVFNRVPVTHCVHSNKLFSAECGAQPVDIFRRQALFDGSNGQSIKEDPVPLFLCSSLSSSISRPFPRFLDRSLMPFSVFRTCSRCFLIHRLSFIRYPCRIPSGISAEFLSTDNAVRDMFALFYSCSFCICLAPQYFRFEQKFL